MALLSPTFALGVFVLLYLSSFVLFAVLRIVTGVSIQRIGYFSLRRLAYTPRDGIRIEIRGLGLNIHRPTFAQPTWLSIVLSDLTVTADVKKLEERKPSGIEKVDAEEGKEAAEEEQVDPLLEIPPPVLSPKPGSESDAETWSRLQKLKEKLKKLHGNVKWLRLVDVVVTNSVVNVVDVGSLQIGSLTLAVDTRHKMADRARFFFHRSDSSKENAEAEWILTLRSVFFAADGGESLQILDHALLNVHGFLYPTQEGLRDATVALKLGRVQIPYDELRLSAAKFKLSRKKPRAVGSEDPVDIFVSKVQDGIADGANDHLMKTVSDSKEFLSSILRGIKEVQFAVSFVGLVKKVESVNPAAKPVHLTASMKEVGVDLHRLDPKSPAHRMYFPSNDIAHEALVAALSISVGMDDGHGKPQRIIYVPMATTTIRTTLPSKTIQLSQVDSFEEKNANILFANSVVTSPSIDLDPRHLPLLIAMMRSRPKPPRAEQRQQQQKDLLSRLLPKASIKFTMHEPVLRIKLKPLGKTEDPDDYGLIISSVSSVALDAESSHSPLEDLHYSLDGAMRLQSHHLYYQAVSGERFDLITTESFDLKVHLAANPEVSVDATSSIQSFSVSMVRPEITDGVRQIVRQLRTDVEPTKRATPKSRRHPNFLRSVPEWLFRYQITANDLNIEIAGVDEEISDDSKGMSLHLDAMSAEYRAQRLDGLQKRMLRRRTHSRSLTQSDSDFASSSPTRVRKKPQNIGDGRRLAFNARGIEAQIIETADQLEAEPFISVPRLEFSLSASSDSHGPVFHVQSSARTFMVQYSLYRHYAVGVAMKTVRKAFMRTSGDAPRAPQQGLSQQSPPKPDLLAPPAGSGLFSVDSTSTFPESVIVDIKVALVQVKAEMPHDPMIMLHIYGLDAGRQRWSTPYFASKLIRLYVATPRMHNIWSRMVSIKSGRLDFRESKHKSNQGTYAEEKLVDISAEAIRIGIPHEVIVHRITDNITNVIKAVQQLQHRFKTGTNEYILEKKPEGPKTVPKVSIRSRNFLFEMEDGAFEWKLGMIYRAGRMEQIQRLTREEAFRVKLNRVREEESRRGNNGKSRSRSAFSRGRPDASSSSWFRSRSSNATKVDERGRDARHANMPRYDPESETLGVNGNSKVSAEEARLHLDMFNAQSWKKRIDRAYQVSRDGVKELRGLFWGQNEVPSDVEETENILEVPPRPALMATYVSNLHITVDKPTFPLEDLPDFIHKVGKGMPRDMKYSLLVPMHIAVDMGEARCSLRDYPLPLLHIPGLKPGQSSRMQSVSLRANFVVAEEFRGLESSRRVPVNIIPPKSADPAASKEGSFAIEVRRTIGPVKSFSDVYMDINTALPTRITWGPCYQPAIQDMMMVVESFTKPQVDPSERVGFWDKLRLSFHSRIHVAWKGDGDMHFAMKGTRDPYQVTGHGAGFLMCWRNDIRWNINAEDNPKKFMTVDSGEYVLAIPDYSMQVREAARLLDDDESRLADDRVGSGPARFKKVVMKLSGRVQWLAGLIFERAIEDGRRSFDFKPHYEVVLKNPLFAKPENGLPYDAMRGFRSRHIHLSIAVRAPADREWMAQSLEPSRSYNTIHLTPRFFTHFFAWWGLFSGPMSLPIRQGNLFPGREKNSKKFGRHLATVKYNLLFAPLFLSHIYKHKDAEDYSENAVSATGLKVRFDSFMLDLHQRREEFDTIAKTKNSPSRITGIKIHAGHLDLACADLRAVSASLTGTTTEAIKKGSISNLTLDQDEKPDLSRFAIPDGDYSWIDMDDFVELDWILPTETHPETKILPLAYVPRLTYFRQTDIGGTIAGDPTRTSPFGNEPTHFCFMSEENDPKSVQAQLIQERLGQLDEQIRSHVRHVGEAELKVIRTDSKDQELLEDFDTLRQHSNVLRDKRAFLETMLERMKAGTSINGHVYTGAPSVHRSEISVDASSEHMDMPSIPSNAEFESEFENRFVIHNMQLKWNNLLRNIVLRYIHQNSQRRGFIYYLSRPAVKFILDMVDEQTKARTGNSGISEPASATPSTPDTPSHEKDAARDLEDRIKSILGDGRKFSSTGFALNASGVLEGSIEDLESGISDEYNPQSSYHVRLIAPQIQLQSEKNKKHVVLVTSKGMELKVVEVMDKSRIADNVSGLVQRRFLVNMDSTQFFVTHQKWFVTNLVSMYAGSKYGTPTGSSWPPWVPMEVMFDFRTDPFGFKRVVQKTSAMLRYDKYNTLRLKYNDEVNGECTDEATRELTENRVDNLWVEFPQARALCNSSQYYAMYVIVLDLLMYSEPLEKTRNERLEKIILGSDFSDLSGIPEMVMKLQDRIRQMEEIKSHFQIYSRILDKRGWEDRLALERDLAASEDELFFMMKAIMTSQRRLEKNTHSNALLKWSISARDIVWHLMQDSNDPLVELQLKDLEYDRTDNADGSHVNLVRVGKLLGLNLLPDATYPEIIAPYHDGERPGTRHGDDTDMIRVYWYMLEAIAGIPVMDQFEIELYPMKIQLERDVGKRLFEYIFPGMDGDQTEEEAKASNPSIVVRRDSNSLEEEGSESPKSTGSRNGASGLDASFSTRPGSLELRLKPTLSSSVAEERSSKKTLGVNANEGGHSFRLFRSGTSRTLGKKSSMESMRPSTATPRPGAVGRSSTGFSSKDGRDSDSKKSSRFGLRSRNNTEDKQVSDDLTKMISRANNYITFAHIKIPSVVLCLSYKGKDQRNFEDVHNFVFRLPVIEWQNKTWSNLDLALALKKAVVRALISHTGAIIGNKFSKHKPNAEQRNRLRELASSSALISPMSSSLSQNYAPSIHDSDDSASMYGTSPIDYSRSPPRSTRSSIRSGIPAPRSASRSSSIASSRSHLTSGSAQNLPQAPSYLTMTPPTPVDASGRAEGHHSNLAIELLRPSSSQGLGSHRSALRSLSGGGESRPSTSAGHLDAGDRKKTGGGSGSSGGFGLRDKLSALTQRMSHRDTAIAQTEEPEQMTEEEAAASPTVAEIDPDRFPRNKRLSWSQSRSKTTG
ncbi:hypothetical protein Trco_008285 [Trichoderma cornu-damae]|uniref:Uncharacterized protein n=1 Tax=Trichoderma cornu-damae TaxID=654480 RepID=A0A9P8QIH1_9HYPO|nr:hypothetical protein Trco_008285 [Trichoderma cornu-damae]